MSYGSFAYLYDKLMQDVPYDKWVEKVTQTVKHQENSPITLLDVGCGTGEITIRLAKEGYKVTGIDLSSDMLSVAQAKSVDCGLSIPYFQQNMVEMEGLGPFDVITIFCDSLNYLGSEEEVLHTFQRVFELVKPGGLFMFDVHSIYKMTDIFQHNTFAVNEEEISYIWHCYEGNWPYSVEHELSFFVLDPKSGQYDRTDELHFQRTFPITQYEQWLKETGFELVEVTADFSNNEPSNYSERIFFTARKIE